jgi:hypothetical protein
MAPHGAPPLFAADYALAAFSPQAREDSRSGAFGEPRDAAPHRLRSVVATPRHSVRGQIASWTEGAVM